LRRISARLLCSSSSLSPASVAPEALRLSILAVVGNSPFSEPNASTARLSSWRQGAVVAEAIESSKPSDAETPQGGTVVPHHTKGKATLGVGLCGVPSVWPTRCKPFRGPAWRLVPAPPLRTYNCLAWSCRTSECRGSGILYWRYSPTLDQRHRGPELRAGLWSAQAGPPAAAVRWPGWWPHPMTARHRGRDKLQPVSSR
jgi:hypothetical protein